MSTERKLAFIPVAGEEVWHPRWELLSAEARHVVAVCDQLRLRSVSTLDSVAPTLRMSRALSRSRARRVHSCIVLESHGLQPELGDLSVAGQMDMRRLAPIAREEEEPIRAALQNRRTHASDSASFPMNPRGSVAIRLTRSRARGYGDCKGSEVDF